VDYLPLFIRLTGEPVLVVGGGSVAARKISLLQRAGAVVRIVAPEISAETRTLVDEHGLKLEPRPYVAADLDGVRLVVSATDDAEVNERVFLDARSRGLLVNTVECWWRFPPVATLPRWPGSFGAGSKPAYRRGWVRWQSSRRGAGTV
jgi:uroporphyrin-III C-methyltransferase/precorrin-2 dehydrogenase/sirohydrochlorin ferrochelatase